MRSEKCLFFQEEIELLGHIESIDGIKLITKLLEKISLFEELKSKTNIKAFLHLYNEMQFQVLNSRPKTIPHHKNPA